MDSCVQRASAAGQAAPVDALHAHGLLRRRRGAGDRARRRLLRLRRARQALSRRALGAVLRERRPRPRRARRGGGASRRRSSASTPTGATRTRARSSWRRASRELAPGNLNRVFFTSGGSEAVESAWKLAKAYHAAARRAAAAQADLAQARLPRHLDGRAHRHRPAAAARAVRAADARRASTCRTPTPTAGARTATRCGRRTRSRRRSSSRGPTTVAAVILEPVQNGGGCFVPQDGYFQRVREICDRHGVLLISDEVICSWGRLGHCSAANATATSPTSSPPPRASPRRTRRWAR